jgi:transposase
MRKLIRRPSRFEGLTVGLDVHQRMIQVSVLDRLGDETISVSIPAHADAMDRLLKELAEIGPVQVSLEATGCFVWIFDLLVARLGHRCVHVAAPSRVRVIAESMEKTDENDAWWLAYLLFEGRLPEAIVVEGRLRALRMATREYRSVTSERADLMRRFRAHLAQLGRRMASADWASAIGRTRIRKLLGELPAGDERTHATHRLLPRIDELAQEQQHWRARIDELAGTMAQVQRLEQALPGIGPLIAAITWAELGDPTQYSSAKAYAKATGLTPGNRESAGRRRHQSITREGSAHARWALTRAVIACLRCTRGPGLIVRRWVEAKAKHKPKKHVVVAAARKLAESIWRLFHLGDAFDPAKAFGG